MSAANQTYTEAPATVVLYCSRCGLVQQYLAAVLEQKKQAPNCPVDTRPLKPLAQLNSDTELGR